MKIAGIIPARYGSSRFPGKPLAELDGEPMLLHVFRYASQARFLDSVTVATESPRIEAACMELGIPVLLTAPDHENPTSRLCEAAGRIPADLYVMIGGDEPLLTGGDIDRVTDAAVSRFAAGPDSLFVVNAMAPVLSPAEALDASNIKIVCGGSGRGLYASRSPVPYPKGALDFTYMKFASIGVYSRASLNFFSHMPKGLLETVEEFDLLRFMERDVPVYFIDTGHVSLSVDTKKDLTQAERMLAERERLQVPARQDKDALRKPLFLP